MEEFWILVKPESLSLDPRPKKWLLIWEVLQIKWSFYLGVAVCATTQSKIVCATTQSKIVCATTQSKIVMLQHEASIFTSFKFQATSTGISSCVPRDPWNLLDNTFQLFYNHHSFPMAATGSKFPVITFPTGSYGFVSGRPICMVMPTLQIL
jgi:hypothetical protein